MAKLPDPQNIQGHRVSYSSEKKGTAIRIEIKEGEGQMTKLKECPFCGGEARLWHPKEYGITLGSVKCNSCGGSTESFTDDDSAIEAWNTRPNPWHTGTPTEEGWYLCFTKDKDIPYQSMKFKEGWWWDYLDMVETKVRFDYVIEWQKIEENEDGCTD